jgi:hypothetical protein
VTRDELQRRLAEIRERIGLPDREFSEFTNFETPSPAPAPRPLPPRHWQEEAEDRERPGEEEPLPGPTVAAAVGPVKRTKDGFDPRFMPRRSPYATPSQRLVSP